MSLLLQMLAASTRRGELVAVVDALDMLDVASLAAAGVVLDRLLWIRGHVVINPGLCRDLNQRAMEQAIRALTLVLQAGNFGLVVLDVGEAPVDALRRLPFTTWLRLQRMVEGQSDGCGADRQPRRWRGARRGFRSSWELGAGGRVPERVRRLERLWRAERVWGLEPGQHRRSFRGSTSKDRLFVRGHAGRRRRRATFTTRANSPCLSSDASSLEPEPRASSLRPRAPVLLRLHVPFTGGGSFRRGARGAPRDRAGVFSALRAPSRRPRVDGRHRSRAPDAPSCAGWRWNVAGARTPSERS